MTQAAKLPVSIEDQIQKQLAELKGQISAPPANKISTAGKIFTLPDGRKTQGPLNLIVLDFVWLLAHYKGTYKAGNPQPPDCWAIGRAKPESGELKPHESVEQPYGEDCKICPKNQWNTADNGRGKACKNQRRLIVVEQDATLSNDPYTLYVSPGALKNWEAYVNLLSKTHGILPLQAITKVSFDEHQTYSSLRFEFVERHDRLNEVWALKEKAQDLLWRDIDTRGT